MTKKKFNADKFLTLASTGPNRWELDNIEWHDRTSNPKTLIAFLERIKSLQTLTNPTESAQAELAILEELAEDLDLQECKELLSNDDDIARQQFIENIARKGAIETLCNNKLDVETLDIMCRLSPNDFILAAKRSQDIINSVRELVIQGETLSDDVAGA